MEDVGGAEPVTQRVDSVKGYRAGNYSSGISRRIVFSNVLVSNNHTFFVSDRIYFFVSMLYGPHAAGCGELLFIL